MTINLSVSAMILAGGQSSRMGQDKALILIQGVPLILYISNIAKSCASPVYIVTSWTERYQEILQDQNIELIKEVLLPGATKPQGPLVGFAQGLAHIYTDWVLLLACDLPNLQIDVLRSWIHQLDFIPQEAIAFLPKNSKGWEPLCGFYRRNSLPLLMEFIEQGGRSFQKWLGQNLVYEITLDNTQLLFNCNTPADLEMGNGEWGMRNGEWGMGNREWGIGNGR